jgi:hypothetical protein
MGARPGLRLNDEDDVSGDENDVRSLLAEWYIILEHYAPIGCPRERENIL